jgi:hypothetical protein
VHFAAHCGIELHEHYFAVAYVGLPAAWRFYERRHPALADLPGVTSTKDHHPGDPINLAMIGAEADIKAVLAAAGWIAAEKLGLKSDLKIAADTVLDRPFADAPVSNLYLWGRKGRFGMRAARGQ